MGHALAKAAWTFHQLHNSGAHSLLQTSMKVILCFSDWLAVMVRSARESDVPKPSLHHVGLHGPCSGRLLDLSVVENIRPKRWGPGPVSLGHQGVTSTVWLRVSRVQQVQGLPGPGKEAIRRVTHVRRRVSKYAHKWPFLIFFFTFLHSNLFSFCFHSLFD